MFLILFITSFNKSHESLVIDTLVLMNINGLIVLVIIGFELSCSNCEYSNFGALFLCSLFCASYRSFELSQVPLILKCFLMFCCYTAYMCQVRSLYTVVVVGCFLFDIFVFVLLLFNLRPLVFSFALFHVSNTGSFTTSNTVWVLLTVIWYLYKYV